MSSVCGIRHLDDSARRSHQLGAHELIGSEPPRTHHPADASAERQSADADRRGVARADPQIVIGEDAGDMTPGRAAADTHERAVDLDIRQRREVECQPARNTPPRAVPAAAHDDRDMLIRSPSHGRPDILDRPCAHDRVGFPRARMGAPGGFPAVVARYQDALRERRNQLIDPHRPDDTDGLRHGRAG
jgi:hypothetical protein